MGRDRSPWQDGRRAWERLRGWHQGTPAASGPPDDGDAALAAMADIGLIRRLLDQAELGAVRVARRRGRSWAEIATQLGVTRQSAWERWRDLDDVGPQQPAGGAPRLEVVAELEAAAAAELVDYAAGRLQAQAAAGVGEGTARQLRRRSMVVVPNVIGMPWDEARHALLTKRLVGVGPDPDGVPVTAEGWPGGTVTDQSPESGAKVPPGSTVRLWVGRGGGSAGVREPRRPTPSPKSAREMRPEPSGEAVG